MKRRRLFTRACFSHPRRVAIVSAAAFATIISVVAAIPGAAQTPTAPQITSSASTMFIVGSPGTFQVTATGDPTPTLSLVGQPGWLTLSSSGVLSGLAPPSSGQYAYAFTIIANNGVSPEAVQAFTLTALQSPVLMSCPGCGPPPSYPAPTLTVGVPVSVFGVSFAAFPAPTLSESGPLPTGLTFTDEGNGVGQISGTPASGTDGTYPFTIDATNGISPDASKSFNLFVSAPPAITSATSATFTVGTAGSFQFTATGDPTPTFSCTGLPAGLSVSSSGLLSGTPAKTDTPGSNTINVFASNGAATVGSQSFDLIILAPPAFSASSEKGFPIGQHDTYSFTVSGDPAPTVTETGTLPSDLTFTTTSSSSQTQGSITGTPTSSDSGTYSVTFNATNGIAPDASQSLTLTIGNVPAITSPLSAGFIQSAAGSFTIQTTGSPAPNLTRKGSLPKGLQFVDNGNGTAIVSGTPVGRGIFHLIITAKNALGSSLPQHFSLVVGNLPSFISKTPLSAKVGSYYTFPVKTLSWPRSTIALYSGSLPAGLSFTDQGDGRAIISGTPTGPSGSYPLVFQATNELGSKSQSVTLTVQ
jgi:Putative Ig domain